MKKRNIIDDISLKADVKRSVVEAVLDAAVWTITDRLQADLETRIPRLGVFSATERAARKGRHPQTGAEIEIAASRAVKFTASKTLKDLL